MEANSAVQFQFNEHDRRISGLHRTVGALATDVGQLKTDVGVLRTKQEETTRDVEEIKTSLEKDRNERREEGTATRKALYTAAAFMATFSVSIMGLIAVLLNHG